VSKQRNDTPASQFSFNPNRKALKGRPTMHIIQNSANLLADTASRIIATRAPADLAYQSVTVAAILLVLGSLWVF